MSYKDRQVDCLSTNQIKPLICMVLIRYAGTKYMVYRGPLETGQDRLELARTENAASEEATGEGSRRSYGYIRRTGWRKKTMNRKTLWTRDQVGVEERLNYYRKEDFEPKNYFVLYSLCRFRCIKRSNGGQTGIRTLETVSRLHTFQACAFDHSATCPWRAV